MGKLTRRPDRPAADGDPLVGVVVTAAAVAAGAAVGMLTHWLLARLPFLRGHDPYEARILGPAAMGGLAAGLIAAGARPRQSFWAVATPAALCAGGYAAARIVDPSAGARELVLLGAVAVIAAAMGGLGAVSGWMDRRRRASRSTWPRSPALAVACAMGALSLAPYALAPVLLPGFDLAVRLGERQIATSHGPPLGLAWGVAAVLVSASTRLPAPVLLLAGVAAVASAAAALAGGPAEPQWLAVLSAALRGALWVVVTGLVLQALHELCESDQRRPLRRTATPRPPKPKRGGRPRKPPSPSPDDGFRGPYLR